MGMDNDSLKKAWKTFGWDKRDSEAFEAIGTPKFKEIMKKREQERLEQKAKENID